MKKWGDDIEGGKGEGRENRRKRGWDARGKGRKRERGRENLKKGMGCEREGGRTCER